MILRFLQWWGAKRPYFDIRGGDGSLYMSRLWLFGGSHPSRDPRPEAVRGWRASKLDTAIGNFFAARLHHIAREDRARDFHNHPASFVSLVLRGRYRERRPLNQAQHPKYDQALHFDTVRRAGGLAYRSASDRHTIAEVSPGGCWTIVIWARKKDEWGFFTRRGFVRWQDYKEEP